MVDWIESGSESQGSAQARLRSPRGSGLYVNWHLQMEALDASVVLEAAYARRMQFLASDGGIDAGCWWLFTTRWVVG